MRARALVLAALCGTAALPVAAATPAGAVNPTITVTTFADVVDGGDGVRSLREAVSLANATAGADRVELPTGFYDLTICDEVRATQDDDNAHGDLDHLAADRLTLAGTGGKATITQQCDTTSGERLLDAADIEIIDLVVRGGDTPADGGGIRTGSATLLRSTITTNTAGGDGGGISATLLDLTSSALQFNVAHRDGGGAAAQPGAEGGWLDATDSTVTDNSASRDGGGIAAWSGTGSGLTFDRNQAGRDGGGLMFVRDAFDGHRTGVLEDLAANTTGRAVTAAASWWPTSNGSARSISSATPQDATAAAPT